MSNAKSLAQLQQLAQLVLDQRLQNLRAAATQRSETLAKLESLRGHGAVNLDENGVASAIAALNYQRWAEARRFDLRHNLARETAVWLDARDAALQAFGKSHALDLLRDRAAQKPNNTSRA
jgi:hypothetical protein